MARRYWDVMHDLVGAIVDGTYAEGAWLPSVQELAARFGCGRGTVREALRGLEERGLLSVRQARGQRVLQRDDWDLRDPDVLVACVERGPDPEVLAHAIDARAAVEAEAARRVATHAPDADLRLVGAYVVELAEAQHPDAFVRAEAELHATLCLLSDNPVLAKLVAPLHPVLAELRKTRAPNRDRAVIRHHQRILEALLARDPVFAAEAIDGYARAVTRWLRPQS